MTVWSHLPTIFKRRHALRIAGILALCVALSTTLFFAVVSHAAPGINPTLSFSARLQNATGGIVPDGYYNIQFKIYQGGDGLSPGSTGTPSGTPEWTETYINNNGTGGVRVKNGYFSVDLGAKTAFGSSIDWNQDTLWLSMNVAGRATDCIDFDQGTCEADGEMTPMKRMTAVPYAMQAQNANTLGGMDTSDFIQNQNGSQQASSNFWLSGVGRADTMLQAPALDTATSTGLSIGGTNATSISLGHVGAATTIQGGARVNDIDTISAGALSIGGSNASSIALKTNGTTRATFDTSNNLYLGNGTASGAPTNFTIQATNSSASSVAGANLIIQGGSATTGDANGGNLVLDGGAKSGSGVGGQVTIGGTNASGITLGNTSSNIVTTMVGTTVMKPASGHDSTVAFQLQRANGTAMLVADSTNQTLTIGDPASANKIVVSTATGQITKYGSARDTKKITLTAEYPGSVLDAGSGSNNAGTMTSSVDMTGRMNYYKWTTSQGSNQSYDVVVQVPIPTDFDSWTDSDSIAVTGWTDNTTHGTIRLEARDSTNTVRCDFAAVTPGSTSTWATNSSACTLGNGNYTPGGYMTLRLRLQSPNGGDVRVGNIVLNYLSNK